jgi:ADP-heptose:LPS heptosyltransferase
MGHKGADGTGTDTEQGTLLIHMGGLGDICLSESVFLSVARHVGGPIHAVGNRRVLELFRDYFSAVDTIDRRRWAYLFSPDIEGPRWRRIVFFGKDRSASLRNRLAQLAPDVLFLDLFPDEPGVGVEDYQLGQLAAYGVAPVKKRRQPHHAGRLILYPERAYQKKKWPPDRFLGLYERLTAEGMSVTIMRPPELKLALPDAVAFEDLRDVRRFFAGGGAFFSNDSGMAHLAGICGLRPLTLFPDADPSIWQAGGSLAFDCRGRVLPGIDEVTQFIRYGVGNPTVRGIWKGEKQRQA